MSIYCLELRNIRKSATIGTVLVCAIFVLLLAFFPSLQTESMKALTGAKLESIDPAVLAALGITELMDFTVITNFFGYVLQFITLAIMVMVTQQAVSLFIKEETDGTIEYLGAKPVSRADIFIQKTLAHLTVFVLMVVCYATVTVTGYVLFAKYNLGAAIKEAAIFFGAIFFVGLVFSSLGVLLSTLLKSNKGAAGITIAIVFGTFLFGILSALIKELDFLIWFSPMDWIKAKKLLNEGILTQEWLIGIVVITGCISAAWLRYRKKDLLI